MAGARLAAAETVAWNAELSGNLFHTIGYHLLYRRNAARLSLEPERFAGRSVLVAGPARTIQEDIEGLGTGPYDVIVKMNNALNVPLVLADGPSWRCDVLFHSLTPDVPQVTCAALDRAGVQCLVHRTPGKSQCPQTLAAECAFGCPGRDVRLIPPERYRQLAVRLGGVSPTTGLVCLDFVLKSRPVVLAVAGFTFFRTKYAAGYDDRDRADRDSLNRVRQAGHHDPEAERLLTKRMFSEAERNGQKILLGKNVRDALDAAPLD